MKKLLFILCAAIAASCAAFAGCSTMSGGNGNSTAKKAPSAVTRNNSNQDNDGQDDENGETPELPELPRELPETPETPEFPGHGRPFRPEPRKFNGKPDGYNQSGFEERADFMRLEIGGRIPFDFGKTFDGKTDDETIQDGDIFAKNKSVKNRKKRPGDDKEKQKNKVHGKNYNNDDDGE